ncbi:MAG: sulfur carrier protein ThiS [Candidatus Omnitrophica bacterium]|nr:sulfur carrier protein ThiS [Candidatus Omnitrophota bacterium]MCA9434944.1 sulfur carrier protein ThiS [Candidatus Omnitrophota bacterium]MCA9444364.1 sulfur carrier protein ThiS [Candidatus Omnitrophota bacterium]
MRLTINGAEKEFEGLDTVADLLGEMGLDPRKVVVELNEKIVRRTQIGETPLSEEDTIEILRFVGGG